MKIFFWLQFRTDFAQNHNQNEEQHRWFEEQIFKNNFCRVILLVMLNSITQDFRIKLYLWFINTQRFVSISMVFVNKYLLSSPQLKVIFAQSNHFFYVNWAFRSTHKAWRAIVCHLVSMCCHSWSLHSYIAGLKKISEQNTVSRLEHWFQDCKRCNWFYDYYIQEEPNLPFF